MSVRKPGSSDNIFRIPPYFYIHVLDQNTNVTRVEEGPRTFIRQDNEKVIFGPEKMITVPPRNYCIIENPVLRDKDGNLVFEECKQVKLKHGEREVRLTREPFALYPGENLVKEVTALTIVPANAALRLLAILDFKDEKVDRKTGDEWLFEGPATYIPRIEVEVVETVRATVIKPNQAILVRARTEMKDRDGNARVTGEEWLVSKVGAYLPGVYEEVVDTVQAVVLTEKKALHMLATRTFKDPRGVLRKNGEEWLLTINETESHIPSVNEKVVRVVDITTLSNRQYCVVLNYYEDGAPRLGQKKLIKGPATFFLQPSEQLEGGIQNIHVLGEDDGLILKATQTFEDGGVKRAPGDRWMIRGPKEYVPPVEVEVVLKRKAIPLDQNEGIYVRDCKTGKVRAVCGETYMLNQNEELWDKDLPPAMEDLLMSARDPLADRSDRKPSSSGPKGRDKTKVINFRVPHNAAVQIYDYKEKTARVVFGPELVMLGPDEQFTQLSLSGGKPKRANEIKSLCLLLGPDFCTDVIVIETSDHARLQLQLSYNWHFKVENPSNAAEAEKLFSVPDFVGDLCKAVASRIRGAVASVQFDDFHKNSSKIIRQSVFGSDKDGKPREFLHFPANNLYITSIDIQSAEPIDQRTRDALQKSVQLAIEITTNSQEAAARHEAERLEQQAKGRLERQKIEDEAQSEAARKRLLELQALSASVESTGLAKADAQSRAEAKKIEGEANVDQAKLRSEALKIQSESELLQLKSARDAELKFLQEQAKLEVEKSRELTRIETEKFKQYVNALGSDTIKSIATAGPDMQVKLLQGLGLKSTLITDGKSPINLFNTANGLIGGKDPSSS